MYHSSRKEGNAIQIMDMEECEYIYIYQRYIDNHREENILRELVYITGTIKNIGANSSIIRVSN